MKRFLFCLIPVGYILVACGAQPQSQNNQPEPDTGTLEAGAKEGSATVSGESLLAEPPAGWQMIYQINNGVMRLSDFIPSDEEKDNWQTKLSFEAHSELKDMDPISIIMGDIKKNSENCSNLTHANLFSGLENNYPTSVRLIECGQNSLTDRGEISLTKAIQGNDYFYIIRLFKKVESFEPNQSALAHSEIADWTVYLKKISLCDADRESHPCSEENSTQEK